jgi:ribosomal protein S18 acetylase RimI-like enzyme
MILVERPDGLKIVRITRPEEAIVYRAAFAGAFQDVWSEPPYNQRVFPSEAEGILLSYLRTPEQITLLAVRGATQVVGFAIGVPAASRPDVIREVRGLVPVSDTFFLAELGLLETWRGKGLGRQLIDLRASLIDHYRYHQALLRVSTAKNLLYELYRRLGYEDVGLHTEVASLRIDGSVTTDRRVYLFKTLEVPAERSTSRRAWAGER